VARRRLESWLRSGLDDYERLRDDLGADASSRLSPYLRFGCLSPLQVLDRVRGREVADALERQLCWRDFFHQVLAANPELPRRDYRPRGDRWSRGRRPLEAWKDGRTGYPIVDAGMRQLRREGFMHNRARLITASFLVKDLYLDWRSGLAHFWDLLLDGDVASNAGNWQWVAGTGNDTRPNRVFNPVRQALRYDPQGDYVRRYVPELSGIGGPSVHEPWKLAPAVRRRLDYPAPIVDHDEAAARFRARRSGGGSAG
jgi:deoxyribodipyrimidine photo-lyase